MYYVSIYMYYVSIYMYYVSIYIDYESIYIDIYRTVTQIIIYFIYRLILITTT